MDATHAKSGSDERCIRPRQRDRRHGLNDVVATLARIIGGRETASFRGAFEEALRQVLPVKTVRLRGAESRWRTRGAPATGESAEFEVMGPSPKTRGVLEARFEPGCQIGEWDFQLLSTAAHLGSLVLEIDRRRGIRLRGDGPDARNHDGAAPLIGSTPAMTELRRQIERIACTEFTVLLEGASDPQ